MCRWSVNPTSVQTLAYSHTYHVKVLRSLALINVYSRWVTGPLLRLSPWRYIQIVPCFCWLVSMNTSFSSSVPWDREKLLVPRATSDITTDFPAVNYCLCSLFSKCPVNLEAGFCSCSLRTGRAVVARVPREQLQSQPANLSENRFRLINMCSALCGEKTYQCLYLRRYDLYKVSLYFISGNRWNNKLVYSFVRCCIL